MRTRLSAVPVAVFALVLLAGCGGGDDKDATAGDAPTKAATSPSTGLPAPSTPATPTASIPGARVKVENGLPSGFPKSEIPLIEADVVNGTVGEPGSPYAWSVVLQPKGEIKDLAARAAAKLEGAGFEAGAKTDLENLQVRQYTNAKYRVGFTATKTGDGVIVTYVVSKLS